jgi:hypothetical protein
MDTEKWNFCEAKIWILFVFMFPWTIVKVHLGIGVILDARNCKDHQFFMFAFLMMCVHVWFRNGIRTFCRRRIRELIEYSKRRICQSYTQFYYRLFYQFMTVVFESSIRRNFDFILENQKTTKTLHRTGFCFLRYILYIYVYISNLCPFHDQQATKQCYLSVSF